MEGLRNSEGVLVTSKEDINLVSIDYFRKLFVSDATGVPLIGQI